jgi:hypothetical protein
MKTIYYYQTFIGIEKLYSHAQDIDTIIVSSIHFSAYKNDPYIHLNDNWPTSSKYDNLWVELQKMYEQGTEIMLMIGGAGGAYNSLFSNFDLYYPLLWKLLRTYRFISGLDLDIEESVNINDVKKLINRLIQDFGEDFTVTMAPVADALINDGAGFGGFSYKELYNSKEGKHISWFNTQCYNSYSLETYASIIKNGYPPEKVVFGLLGGDYDGFTVALHEIIKTKEKYKKMLGVFVWEYLIAPPDKKDPSQFCKIMKGIIDENEYVLVD